MDQVVVGQEMPEQLRLSQEVIDRYLQDKLAQGVSPGAVAKYRTPLYRLLEATPVLTVQTLGSWRKALEEHGYSKLTVQNYVKVVNDFLRTGGHGALCIPRPLRYDLTGEVFGYLTAVEPTEKRSRRDVVWKCRCRCGRETEVPAVLLRGGNTTSCGCLNKEVLRYANRYVEGTSLRQSLTDQPLSHRAASGYTGVLARGDKWEARIAYKGVRRKLGTYTNLEDAVKARARAKEWIMEDAARLWDAYADCYGEAPHRPMTPKHPAHEEEL